MPAAPTCAPRAIQQKQAAQGTESRLFQKPARLCRTGFYKQKKELRKIRSSLFLQSAFPAKGWRCRLSFAAVRRK